MNMKIKMIAAAAVLTAGTMGLSVKAQDSTIEAQAEAASDNLGKAAEQTGQFMSDAALTAKVKAKLATVDGLHDMEIKVDTDNGVVKLMGEVESQAEISLVEAVVSGLDGVVDVDNQLEVDHS